MSSFLCTNSSREHFFKADRLVVFPSFRITRLHHMHHTVMTTETTSNHNLNVGFFYGNPGIDKESSSCRGSLYVSSEHGGTCSSAAATFLVAIIDVPPDQVPNGIMNLLRSYWSMLHHVRVVISNVSTDCFAGPKTFDSTSPEQAYTVLILVKNTDIANNMVENLHDRPFTSLQMNIRAKVYHVARLEDEYGTEIQLQTLFPSVHPSSSGAMLNPCPVCLDTLTTNIRSSSPCSHGLKQTTPDTRNAVITTACTHSFHLDCFVKCQDSPCPVCRFDHSTLNDSLSSCHACGATDHIYICLICGVVSCQAMETDESPNRGHARIHYQQTLHAYALEVHSQHVFDFAGDGYVHRLIQNKEDGKLVEVTDPNNAFQERTYTPGLSDEQQEEVVHVKLERLAHRYQNMLRHLMDQQRHYYQDIMVDLRRQLEESKSSSLGKPNENHARKNTNTLQSALKQERNQLQQRHDSLKKKHVKIMEDLAFVKDFNESLETNQESLRRQVANAQQERRDIDDLLSKNLPPLQQRLIQLIADLEKALDNH